MDDENNIEKSDSTEEVDEKSDTETECFDKGDSDYLSQSEKYRELKCTQCKINFQTFDELEAHKKQRHPMIVYGCQIENCPRWFSSSKSRDKHSGKLKSRFHKCGGTKPPPSNAIFIENASAEQLEIVKSYVNIANRPKGKRGPKPKITIEEVEKNFLIGLPKDQLKRKLMESVVEKIESSPTKKHSQGKESSPSSNLSKRRISHGQLSNSTSLIIPNVSSPKSQVSKSAPIKASNLENKHVESEVAPTFKSIPNLSQLKVPLLSFENESFSLPKFSEDIIGLLSKFDVAEYFKYPLIDHFAPGSSQLLDQIDMRTIKERLRQGHYSKDIENIKSDLLKLYSNGLRCFDEKSLGWRESAKLYQTTLVNIEKAESILVTSCHDSKGVDCGVSGGDACGESSKCPSGDSRAGYLGILNPYNCGRLSDHERVISIGDQGGKLKTSTQYLSGFKEDRRNKISILSYLNYGANFSFGPCYDSGNAYCTKEVSDLLIRGYGDQVDQEEEEELYRDLNEIIPEPFLGDDFSLYLMNVFTRDILRSCQEEKSVSSKEESVCTEKGQELAAPSTTDSGPDICIDDGSGFSRIQRMLDNNSEDLKQLKYFNYQRLAGHQTRPSNDECLQAAKVTDNLTTMISEVTPRSVTDRASIRKALQLV